MSLGFHNAPAAFRQQRAPTTPSVTVNVEVVDAPARAPLQMCSQSMYAVAFALLGCVVVIGLAIILPIGYLNVAR